MQYIRITAIATMIMAGVLSAHAETGKETSADKEDTYPLKTCVVSGDRLDAMGEPVIYDYKGQEIRFCCKDCIKDFLKKPEKYLAKLEKAEAGHAASGKAEEAHDHASHGKQESGHEKKAETGHATSEASHDHASHGK